MPLDRPSSEKPSLETLKKRAKQIVRWRRDGVYTVAEQIRSILPRFAGMSDEQIFAAQFRLADAQEMIARQNGFESWQALRTGYETMSTPDTSMSQPVFLQNATPIVFVQDIERSCAHFADVLGFRTLFKYGQPPFFAMISRDGASLGLRCVDEAVIDRALVAKEDLVAAMIAVSSLRMLKQLFSDFTQAGAEFHQSLKKQPWGGHDFIVKDPDGNLLEFGCGD
jgi:catechol 2,3-dioxygenase-like lactoylglutathione lyase family enzyme